MSKDLFFRAVLRGLHESPTFGEASNQSPMTSLAHSLLGANLDGTPCKRLSLSSSTTFSDGTPELSCLYSPDQSCGYGLKSVGGAENSPLSPNQIGRSPRNKENLGPTPYYSPSHARVLRHSITPLREVQNTATRSLSFSPLKQIISPSRREHLSPVKIPTPPDECDSNSRDSGYSESGQKKDLFSIPRPVAPTRRLNLDMPPHCSPFKSPHSSETSLGVVSQCSPFKLPHPSSGSPKVRSFSSLTKTSEEDDALLLEFICGQDEQHQRPSIESDTSTPGSLAFSSLLSAPIQANQQQVSRTTINNGSTPRLPIRRCLSMFSTSAVSPLSRDVNMMDISKSSTPVSRTDSSRFLLGGSFKRPASPEEPAAPSNKRLRTQEPVVMPPRPVPCLSKMGNIVTKPLPQRQLSEQVSSSSSGETERHKFQRCLSESHVSIMRALNISSNRDEHLTGDFSQALSLPVLEGTKHPDLKTISIHTLADVLRCKYRHKIGSVRIIDCRYPYEYDGGHVFRAENWYHPKMIYDFLDKQDKPPKITPADSLRNILIFHCEFSAERAPRAQRILREIDRTANKDHYPALHFPEMYLLEGGYKAFYETYPELCTPLAYVKMLDENHTEDFKFFRSKSKSWAAENSKGKFSVSRTVSKRLGL